MCFYSTAWLFWASWKLLSVSKKIMNTQVSYIIQSLLLWSKQSSCSTLTSQVFTHPCANHKKYSKVQCLQRATFPTSLTGQMWWGSWECLVTLARFSWTVARILAETIRLKNVIEGVSIMCSTLIEWLRSLIITCGMDAEEETLETALSEAALRRVHMDTAKRIECAFNPVCKCSHESA